MEYNYPNRARLLQNDIIGGINTLYNSLSIKNMNRCRASLSDAIKDAFGSLADENLSIYADFLSKVLICAYFQKFDNDKDIESMKEDYEKSLQASYHKAGSDSDFDSYKKEQEKDFIIPDFMFGFEGLTEFVTSAVEILSGYEGSDRQTDESINSNLLTRNRNISVEEYLAGGYIEKDIKLVAMIGEVPPVDTYAEIIDFIKTDNYYRTFYESATISILGVYKYLFQDGFGLREYEGVVSFVNSKCFTISSSHRLSSIEGASTVFRYVANALASDYDVIEKGNRQFKVKEIINSTSEKPMYFPKKILEYAKGRQLTYRLSEGVYRPHEKCSSWDEYENAYVKQQVEDIVCQGIYFSMEKHFNFKSCCKGAESFTDEDFKIAWASKRSQILNELVSIGMSNQVDRDLQKLIKSMCTACVVVTYNNLGGTVNSIKLRIVDTTESLQTTITQSIFRGCTANKSIEYADGDIITEGKKCSDSETPLPYQIFEFSHDFNAALSNAEPLFGYKAVELYQKRGIALSWDKILLGEDIKGTPIFASMIDRDDIHMQEMTLHNMMAGSRSGKGVMTMNILASAVAEEKPIFYVDRKPEMAVMFTQLSQGNMFCINGGQYEQKNDPRGFCSDTGIGTQGWKQAYQNMPQFLKDKLFRDNTYIGDFGDFAYYRACLFVLSILVARVKLAGSEHYNALGGNKGVVIVIDEFKNWQEKFESSWFTPNGLLGNQNRVTKNNKKDYRKLQADIKVLQAQLSSGSMKPEQQLKAELNLETKMEELSELITPLKVYCTEVMDKYGETVKAISELMAAGFKDREGKLSDIFVIGQNIKLDGYDGSAKPSGTYALRDSGEFAANADTNDKSLMRGIFEMFPHDWFMGYNYDCPDYMGASNKGSTPDKWLNGKKYWAYCRSSMESLRTSEPPHARYFKPYLVLNNHLEDDPNEPKTIQVGGEVVSDPDYMFISQCRDRVNNAVPNLWEKVRIKHCKKDLTTGEPITTYGNLNEGIGFEGLANMTRHTNGLGDFNPAENLGQSADIANYVARCMGYADYKALIFDFSPEGIFSARDVVNAIQTPGSFQNKAKVLPLHAQFGFIGGIEDEVSDPVSDRSYDEDLVDLEDTGGGIAMEVDTPTTYEEQPRRSSDDGWTKVYEDKHEEEPEFVDMHQLERDIRTVCENVYSMKAREYGVQVSNDEVHAFGDMGIRLLRKMIGGTSHE